jgi:PAS domain S-box-containing protein
LLEQSPSCGSIVDASGAFVRTYGNVADIFGKSGEQLAGHTALETVGVTWSERFTRALRGETLMLRERTPSGTWNVSVFPIRMDGEIRYAAVLARDVTQWASAERELRNTVLGAMKAQEYERAKLSRFLHDSVGQNLTALGLQLDLIRMDLEGVAPEACGRVVEIQKVLESIMEQVREYSYELNPSTVERAGLRPALDRLVARVRARFSGTLRLNVDPSLKVDPKIASAMYQIGQEAVENAVQHASCSAIEIALKSTRNGLALEVRDNGRGFDPADIREGGRGLGLLSMEHYAAQAGLELTITSNLNGGTLVRAAAGQAL